LNKQHLVQGFLRAVGSMPLHTLGHWIHQQTLQPSPALDY
jgi:hypothetical protein